MKLLKSIVDKNNKLVGFLVEGRENEFKKELTTKDKVEKHMDLATLISTGVETAQISFKGGRIQTKRNFQINHLPMLKYDGAKFIDIDNSITLLMRVLHKGEIAGFKINVAGKEASYRYEDVIRLAGWMNPTNFVVRHMETGKAYIAGKPGHSIEDLPELIMGEDKKTSKRKRVSSGAVAAPKKDEIDPSFFNDKDLITLLEILQETKGFIIKLPNEDYKVTAPQVKKAAEGFQPINLGEIASPYINFTENKINASANFKKPGRVVININGQPSPIYTFTYATKNIFFNGENHIKRFGIAVNAEGAKKLSEAGYDKALTVRELNSAELTEATRQLTGNPGLKLLEVDASKLSIISKNSVENRLLTPEEIFKHTEQMIECKIYVKLMNAIIKEIDPSVIEKAEKTTKKPFGIFGAMSEDALNSIREAGIDIYSGAYTKTEDVSIEDLGDTGATSASMGSDEEYSVEYKIRKRDYGKLNIKLIQDGKEHKLYAGKIKSTTDGVLAEADESKRLALAEKVKKAAEKQADKIREALWLHRAAMYQLGKGLLHQHDKNLWEHDEKARGKGENYNCLVDGLEDLYVVLKGYKM